MPRTRQAGAHVRVGWILACCVIAFCVAYLVFTATRTTAMYYRTIAEARADMNASQNVRVIGVVQPGVRYLEAGQMVHFAAGAGRDSMPVEYRGALPDIFRPGIQVVMDGHMRPDGVFEASSVLAKCPSRFGAATQGSP